MGTFSLEDEEGELNMQKHYLTRQEAACYLSGQGLRVSKNTLQKFATVGGGPEYSIFGNRALYTPDNLIAWVEARLSVSRKSTSEAK
jgi:hypothetical protein